MLLLVSKPADPVGTHRTFQAAVAAAILVLATCVAPAVAQDGPAIVRIEEDWELVLLEPHPESNAPQVTCVISPVGDIQSVHAAFELNHRTLPTYASGRLQLQVWDGEDSLEVKDGPQRGLLRHPGETVLWTQQMWLEGDTLNFEIVNGSSPSWGPFGGQSYLKLALPTDLESLGGYSSSVSTKNSGIGFASNRVARLVLKEVRSYTAAGLLNTDTTPKVVHEQ